MGEKTDVVCGMKLDSERAKAQGLAVERDGRSYYFCSEQCQRAFEQDASRYSADAVRPRAPDGKTNERYAG